MQDAALTSVSGHGFAGTKGDDDPDPADKTRASISASVLKVPGSFVCAGTGGAACDITVSATYLEDAVEGRPDKLGSITLAATASGTIYFRPNNAAKPVSLRGDLPGNLVDEQYMRFGWWQETPAQANNTPKVAVFHRITGAAYSATAATGTATYQGPAAGLYVEESATEVEFGGVKQTVVESGEFTATATLRANFGDSSAAGTVEGDVTGFKTSAGNKSWRVELGSVAPGVAGDATIVQADKASTGHWEHTFLARHDDADDADTQPIAAVGRFEASIINVRHIAGAFGVHRTVSAP